MVSLAPLDSVYLRILGWLEALFSHLSDFGFFTSLQHWGNSTLQNTSISTFSQWTAACLALAAIVCITLVLCLRRHDLTIRKEPSLGKNKGILTSSEWTQLFNMAKESYIRGNAEKLISAVESREIDVKGYRDPATGLTLLLCACLSGDGKLVTYLLNKGANPRAVTKDEDSSLLLATYACCSITSANQSILDRLACQGVNINACNLRGDSALSIAAMYGQTKLISILLQYGADPDTPNTGGILPIDFAKASGISEAVTVLEAHSHRPPTFTHRAVLSQDHEE